MTNTEIGLLGLGLVLMAFFGGAAGLVGLAIVAVVAYRLLWGKKGGGDGPEAEG